MPSGLRFVLVGALAVYGAALLVVLMTHSSAVPSGLVHHGVSLGIRLHAPDEFVHPARVEFGLNVVAFVPLSLIGSLLRPAITVSTWTALGFGGSLLVEAIQTSMPDRLATHSDVVANTLGAALGAMVAWVLARVAARALVREPQHVDQ